MQSKLPTSLLLVAVVALSVSTGCQSLRVKSRNDLPGAPGLVVSQFAPEDAESCTSVGQEKCAYITIALKSIQRACAEKVSDRAVGLGANYIWVNEPKQSVAGIKTRSPYENFYRCEALILS